MARAQHWLHVVPHPQPVDGTSGKERRAAGWAQRPRLAAYLDFQMLIADAAPAIFLYAPHYDYAVSQRVHGVRLNSVIQPGDRFQYVTQWYVNTGG